MGARRRRDAGGLRRGHRLSALGWPSLFARSWRLGLRWLGRSAAAGGVVDARQGLYRMLVPIEPWRYYELGRVARARYSGRWLDVGSPKLLASALQANGRGSWVAVDLFEKEVERWRRLDPGLDLRVEDARELGFADGEFDGCVCISVVEHIPGDGDTEAMAEMWRVLRPGGVLRLTTNVAAEAGEVTIDEPIYGDVSERSGEGFFFERWYTETTLKERLMALPWEIVRTEYVRERLPIHRAFFAARPLSFAVGNLLPIVCAWNTRRVRGPFDLPEGRHGVVSLTLRKPGLDPV